MRVKVKCLYVFLGFFLSWWVYVWDDIFYVWDDLVNI